MVYTHFLPPPPDTFSNDNVAVVIDILRATSVMAAALKSGATAIFPCLEVDEAKALATQTPGTLLCGERQGLMPEGFDFGNSPSDYTHKVCGDRPIVMTTTNGTRALMASASAGLVYTLSFGNILRVYQTLAETGAESTRRSIHLVCSGTDGQVSWEDSLAAGMLANALASAGIEPGNDATRIAISLYENELWWLDIEAAGPQPGLVRVLKQGRGGRRVCEIGLEKDIREVARVNDFDVLPQLIPGPWRVVAAKLG